MPATAEAVDALLPQTQCMRCGFDDCRAYAEALARGESEINRCPPGGEPTLHALSALLGRTPRPLDPACGTVPAQAIVAFVEEDRCIGCFKCVQACPVDAIVGAPKFMHTVIAAECSGCELCLPVCPTDCIVLQPRAAELPAPPAMAPRWRAQHARREKRLSRLARAHEGERARHRAGLLRDRAADIDLDAAVARSRAHRGLPS